MPAPRLITAEDLYRFRLVSDPQISPGGDRVAYAEQWADTRENKYFSNLWMAPEGVDGEPRAFTTGNQSDRAPRWSPDGRTLAFLSDRDEKCQIWTIPTDGGEAKQLTQLEEGSIGDFDWSPDGTRLVFSYRPKRNGRGRRPSKSGKKRSAPLLPSTSAASSTGKRASGTSGTSGATSSSWTLGPAR